MIGIPGKKLTIIYLCHYFAPEIGAPSARIYEMAQQWVSLGHTVKVVTCFPNHPTGVIPPEYRGKSYQKEMVDGIEVYRNWVYATPNEGFIKKTLGHLSFMFSSVLFSTRHLGKADVIIVSSPTFFSVFSAWFISKVKHIPLVLEVRDLWPAALVELGVLTNTTIIKLLENIEMWFYRKAKAVVNVTHSFCDVLASRGVPREKLYTITNGVDTTRFFPQSNDTSFRKKHGLEGNFVVLYTGAHGISQALGRIIDVAERVADDEAIKFVFIGEGAEKAALLKRVQESGLANVLFLPSVSKNEMAEVYASSDICLVPLRDIPLFKTFIPSKMFEIMACARPIVASVAGEAAEILTNSGGAIVTPPEDVAAIEQAIRTLAHDPSMVKQLALAGHHYAFMNYSRHGLANDYIDILQSVTATPTREGVLA
ncbi:MAG: glycosyltransferase family 4 protein [bacterium]